MLIGGFYSIDLSLLNRTYVENFKLPLDVTNAYTDYTYTNNGRTSTLYALQQLAKYTTKRTIILPDYLCLSVITSIEASEFKYKFYQINSDLSANLDSLEASIDNDTAAIYMIHYFGVPQSSNVLNTVSSLAQQKNLSIIEDLTQSLFSSDFDKIGFGDFIVASTRKWFPMTDGGICIMHNSLTKFDFTLHSAYNEACYKELLISIAREYYHQNSSLNSSFYLDFEKNANKSRYDDMLIRNMTDESKSVLFNSDISELMSSRKKNYEVLYNGLKSNHHVTILQDSIIQTAEYIPFGFLILVENRDEFYDYLVDHNIIPEIQWKLPLDRYNPGESARYISDHNIMIQCDQRYSEFEMQYVVDTINNYKF